jgi:hypothetical protein
MDKTVSFLFCQHRKQTRNLKNKATFDLMERVDDCEEE